MSNKEHYDLLEKSGIHQKSKAEHVEWLANMLLEALLIPTHDGVKRDAARCDFFGIDEEPINFGSLNATCEEQECGKLLVTIEEAAPNECPTLCDYVRRYLAAWGWGVEVETEW